MTKALKLGFIGGGNMARALMGGLRAGDAAGNSGSNPIRDPIGAAHDPASAPRDLHPLHVEFVVIEPDGLARQAVIDQFGAMAHATAHTALTECDAIIVAVKPQQFEAAARGFAPFVSRHLIISVAAGIPTTAIARWLGGHATIVRAMPNTPALIGAGMTGLFATAGVVAAQRQLAEALLGAVGQTVWVNDERQLDAVTAISGSGPAYVFYFIEAMQRAALELGLPADAARQLSLQTFLGAARLAAQSDEPAGVLRERVTSKGGTTFAALTSMERDGVADALVRAMRAAAARSAELGDEFGKE